MAKLRNILIFFLLSAATVAQAQTLSGTEPVQYIVAPETPGPLSPVSITVQGVGTFLGDASVTWTVDGKIAKSGAGLSSFSFTTGALGSRTIVKVTIDSDTQGTITHTFTFTPSTIDLVWEADTSVPPLYSGKALYSAGSNLRVIAFPTVIVSGKKVSADSLSYQWSVNDTPIPSASGAGKYVLSYTGDQLQNGESVAVDAYFGSLKVGHGEVDIPVSQSQLTLYAKDPLRGILFDQAVPQGINLNEKELSIFAQPYFFANSSIKSGSLSWSWNLNGNPVTGPQSDQGVLTLRQTGEGQGEASLEVNLQNNDGSQIIQSASTALRIVFGKSTSILSSFLGL